MGMFLLLAIVCAVVCVVSAEYVSIQAYYNSETTTTASNEHGNVEYHCFSSDTVGGAPNYVRGTYGRRGYFEGYVTTESTGVYVANVNFFEIGIDTGSLLPNTGSAQLTYSNNYNSVTGFYWASGENNIFGSRAEWGITGKCTSEICDVDSNDDGYYDDNDDDDVIQSRHCFYKPSFLSGEDARDKLNEGKTNHLIFGPEGQYNVLNHVGVGSQFTAGHMVGAYDYIYDDDACADLDCETYGDLEHGTYGNHAISANLMSIKIIATTWTAISGPMTGQSGSSLYAIAYDEESVDDDNEVNGYRLFGFFCNAEYNPNLNLTGCVHQLAEVNLEGGYSESIGNELMARPYQVVAETNRPLSQNLRSFVTAAFKNSHGFLRTLLSAN